MNEHRRSCATNDEWRCSFFEHRAMLKSANGYSPSDISLIFEPMDKKRTSSPPAKIIELFRLFLESMSSMHCLELERHLHRLEIRHNGKSSPPPDWVKTSPARLYSRPSSIFCNAPHRIACYEPHSREHSPTTTGKFL